MDRLAPDVPRVILQLQTAATRRGSPCPRVGALLQQHSLLGHADCEAIAAEQKRRRALSLFSRVSALRVDQKSASKYKFLVALLSALGVLASVFSFHNPLSISLGVASAAVTFISFALDYAATIDRSIVISSWQALKLLFYFLLVTLVGYGLYLVLVPTSDLTEILSRHTNTNSGIRQEVGIWVDNIKLALYSFVAVVLTLLSYSLWKYRALQLSEARFGEMKDLLIRIEQQLRDTAVSVEQRHHDAINLILRSLCTLIQSSPSIQAVKALRYFVRDRTHVITAWYLVPNNTNRNFDIVCGAYPDANHEHFQWLKDNYKPAFYDDGEFKKLESAARGKDCKGWHERLLNMAEQRSRCPSLTGYTYATQRPVMEPDPINSIYFDHNFVASMETVRSLNKNQLPWFAVGSLIGFPVVGDSAGKGNGVLLVVNNTRYGFQGEDFEAATVAAQLISRVLALR